VANDHETVPGPGPEAGSTGDSALRESEERYRLLVDGVRDYAILTLDPYGVVTSWNAGAQLIKGYRPEEIIGQHFSVFYPPEDLAAGKPAAELVEAAAAGRLEDEGWRVRKDGSRFWANVVITALYDDNHQLRGFGKLTRDITERREAEQALRRQAAELLLARDLAEQANMAAQAATRAKSTFLATMSHEIRTPMNAVIGMTGLLLDMDLEPVQRDYLETIRASGDALLGIINNVLDYSKIESGALELEHQPFDVQDLMEGALELVAAQAGDKPLDLLVDIAADCPHTLVGDVTRLRQVVVNLLSNAVKFTPSGEVVVAVRTSEEPEAGLLLHLAVSDTGIGIAADRMDRLFLSFSQVEASTTRNYGGTGLGLAISARLVEAMGGRIAVDSEPGRGSTFHFTIPTVRGERPAVSGRPGPDGVAGLHALVVDDSSVNRRILQRQLDGWGASSDAVDGAAAALHLAAENRRYDVGILDLDMPGMDGVDLAVALHNLPDHAGLPLLLLSSQLVDEARGREARLAAQLLKPTRSLQLHRALVRAVTGGEPARSSGGASPAAPASSLRVLLVEDNAVNQKLALLMLARQGFRADVAANGSEALAALLLASYDIVCMDLQMPVMDGLEATRRIRQEVPAERQPRIIAMTADATSEDRKLCLEAGMDDYLSKPVRMDQLAAALARCTELAAAPIAASLRLPRQGAAQGGKGAPLHRTGPVYSQSLRRNRTYSNAERPTISRLDA